MFSSLATLLSLRLNFNHIKNRREITMLTKMILCLTLSIGTTMATVDDCPVMHFWNGKQCLSCSKCPRGFGVKENCSAKRDTECEPCWPGYDYSDTNSFQRCIICDTYSNCLPGNHKMIKNCTIFSKPVCQGCAEGNFFNPNVGMNGGCDECSPPCGPLEVETRSCNTDHDRTCEVRSLSTIPNLKNTPTSSPKDIPNSTHIGGKAQPEDPALAASGAESPATTPLVKNPELWIGVGVGIALLVVAVVVAIIRRKSNNPRNRDVIARVDASTHREDTQQSIRLMSSAESPYAAEGGLGMDLPIKNLTIDGKRFIEQRLNSRYHDGYLYWQMTAEKLGLRNECEAWKNADNPTKKLLQAYGEKEGSTIRTLVNVLRDPAVDLTQIAKEIEDRFSPPQDQGEPETQMEQGEEEERTDNTYV